MNQKFTSNNFLKRIRISKKKVSFGKFLEKQCSLALNAKKTKVYRCKPRMRRWRYIILM